MLSHPTVYRVFTKLLPPALTRKDRKNNLRLPRTISIHAVHPFIKLFHFYFHNRGRVFLKNRAREREQKAWWKKSVSCWVSFGEILECGLWRTWTWVSVWHSRAALGFAIQEYQTLTGGKTRTRTNLLYHWYQNGGRTARAGLKRNQEPLLPCAQGTKSTLRSSRGLPHLAFSPCLISLPFLWGFWSVPWVHRPLARGSFHHLAL